MRKTGTYVDHQRRKRTIRESVVDVSPRHWPTALIICPKSLINNVSTEQPYHYHWAVFSQSNSGAENWTPWVSFSDVWFSFDHHVSGVTLSMPCGSPITGGTFNRSSSMDIWTSVSWSSSQRSPKVINQLWPPVIVSYDVARLDIQHIKDLPLS